MKNRTRKIMSFFLGFVLLFPHFFPSPAAIVRAAEEPVYVYKLTDELADGNDYLIVSSNSKDAYALSNPGGTSSGADMGATSVTLQTGDIDQDGTEDVFIADAEVNEIWSAATSSSGFHLTNGTDTLEGKSGNVKIFDSFQYADRYWVYESEQLKFGGTSVTNTYTLYYSNGFTSSYSSTSNKVYLYVKTQIGQNDAAVTGVNVSPAQLTIKVGRSEKLTAVIEPVNAANKQVSWTSSNAAVASVSVDGTVTGVSSGNAMITATTEDGEYTGTCAVTVEEVTVENYILVDAFTSGKDYLIVSSQTEGSAYAMRNPGATSGGASVAAEAVVITNGTVSDDGTAVLHISAENTEDIAWRATANGSGFNLTNSGGYLEGKSGKVAIFTSLQYSDRYWTYSGQQLQHKGGQNTYTVYYSDGFTYDTGSSSTEKVYLFEKYDGQVSNIPVTGVTVKPSKITLQTGQSQDLSAVVEPANATNPSVSWTSNNEAVAVVSATGKVTATAEGSAVITATTEDGGFTGTCTVTVTASQGPVEPETRTVYLLVNALTNGKEYLIVSKNEAGSANALRNPGATSDGASLAQTQVGILLEDVDADGTEDLYIENVSEDAVWAAGANGSGFNLTNSGGYLEGKSGNIRIYSSQQYGSRYWTYSGQQLQHKGGQSTYTLYYSNNAFTGSVSSSSEKIYIYEKTEVTAGTAPVSGVTLEPAQLSLIEGRKEQLKATVLPADAANKRVAWASENTSVATVSNNGLVTAVAAGTTKITVTTEDGGYQAVCQVEVTSKPGGVGVNIGITSDVHGNVSGLRQWITAVQADVEPDLDSMLYCGDYSYKMQNLDDFVAEFQQIVAATNELVGEGKGIYTSGNHEYYIGGREIPLDERFTSTPGFVRIGEALVKPNYIVYCLGAAGWGNNAVGDYPDEDVAALEAYLATAPSDIPIFIPAHFPLHYVSGRTVTGAKNVIDVLNEHPNVIFLWGHNHSQNDTHYGQIIKPGGTITYASGNDETINFTYACAGGMYQESQTKYSGLVCNISDTGDEVTFRYYQTSTGAMIGEETILEIDQGQTPAVTYTVEASAGENGTIQPSGTVTVREGKSQTFTFAPEAGYEIDTVTVDGEPVEVSGFSYIFTDVRANHTINVTFRQAAVTSYQLVENVQAGGRYLIVSNDYALYNDNGTIHAVPVAVSADGKTVYITDGYNNDSAFWTLNDVTGEERSGDYTVKNGAYMLSRVSGGESGGTTLPLEITTEEKYSTYSGLPYFEWSYDASNTELTMIGGQNGDSNFYAYYNTEESAFYTTTDTQKTGFYGVSIQDWTWDDPTYEWAEDYSSVTAMRIGNPDTTQVETETVETTAEVTKPATCTDAGETTYTAVFTNPSFISQTKTVVNIAALGHDWGAWTVTKAATCTEKGEEKRICNRCEEEEIRETEALGHEWGEASYEWAKDNSSVIGTIACVHDTSHVVTENVQTKAEVTKPATCTDAGETTYTAVFTNPEFTTQTKTVENIAALGHDWGEASYVWAKDNASVTAKVVCSHDTSHVETETVQTKAEVTKPATCTETGKTTYTAVFTNPAFVSQTKTVENIAALGHEWGEASYEWAKDNASVTAKVVCAHDTSHVETETVQTKAEVTKPATCTNAGETTYTAVFTNLEFTTQTKTVENIAALGHEWGEASYVWAKDNGSVTAKVVCAHDTAHMITETVETIAEVTKPATCTDAGKTSYTAVFTNPLFISQTKTVENIAALGHDWTMTAFIFSDDYSSAEATFICRHNHDHVLTMMDSKPSVDVVQKETCENDRVVVYTAKVVGPDDMTYTTKSGNVIIPGTKLGHDWGEPSYVWADDLSSITATAICINDEKHIRTETVETTYVETPATCEKEGSKVYTAVFEDEYFETQVQTVVLPAIGHEWRLESFIFAEDYNNAIATFVCRHDQKRDHVVKVTDSKPVARMIREETCETDRVVVYVATVIGPDGEDYSYTTGQVILAGTKLGHDWGEASYEWAKDNSSVTGTIVCAHDSSHVVTETVQTKAEVTKPATCTEAGETTYTAVFTNPVFATQTKTVENIAAIGHEWGEASYEWAKDYSSVTGTIVCAHDPSHVVTETVQTKAEVTKPATCTEPGETTYTAVFTNPAFATQTKTVENIAALGHEWGEASYEWAKDNSSVTGTIVCAHDTSHVVTETTKTEYKIAKEASCEKDGVGTYTAKFEDERFETQTREVVIPATGHVWDTPIWNWSNDYLTAEAVFTCGNDPEHHVTLAAEVVQTEGTGEDEGFYIYTATVTGPDGNIYTDVKKAKKPIIGELIRVYGDTRYKTSLAVAEELRAELGIDKFDSVILATGAGYADALAGSYLASAKGAPILLTGPKYYNQINGYIKEHVTEGGTIYILGGQKAVADELLSDLEDYDLQRVFGDNRYMTALAILEEVGVAPGEEVIICTGKNYADSLSAASTGKPIFLMKETLNNRQKEMLRTLAGKGCIFTILGGEQAVTPETEAQIRSEVGDALTEERIAGSTRYQTSRMIAERYFPEAKSVVLAIGNNYPDGLCGGLLAGIRKAPILLTVAGKESIAKIYTETRDIHVGLILGGPKLISDDMARDILGLDESVVVIERFYK